MFLIGPILSVVLTLSRRVFAAFWISEIKQHMSRSSFVISVNLISRSNRKALEKCPDNFAHVFIQAPYYVTLTASTFSIYRKSWNWIFKNASKQKQYNFPWHLHMLMRFSSRIHFPLRTLFAIYEVESTRLRNGLKDQTKEIWATRRVSSASLT